MFYSHIEKHCDYHIKFTMSRKIPEVVLLTSEQGKQRSEQDKRAYEESITNYTNKFISTSDTSQPMPMVDTQPLCTKQVVYQPPLIYNTRSEMEHDEKVSGASCKIKCVILDEEQVTN